MTVILRRAARDTELAGVKIDEGADTRDDRRANRDERKYQRPGPLRPVPRSANTSVSASASTSAWACTSLAWSRASPSTRFGPPRSLRTLDPEAGPPRTSRAWPSTRHCPCPWCSPPGGKSPRMDERDNPLRDAAAIVGIGQTEFAKIIDRPESQLAARPSWRPPQCPDRGARLRGGRTSAGAPRPSRRTRRAAASPRPTSTVSLVTEAVRQLRGGRRARWWGTALPRDLGRGRAHERARPAAA